MVQIIYDEWHEIYEFYEAFYQKSLGKNNFFSGLSNRANLAGVLQRRLNARLQAAQALFNLAHNSHASKRELKILDLITKIRQYNENFLNSFSLKISEINETNPNLISYENDALLDVDVLKQLKENVSELSKRSFDEEQRLSLIEFGGLQVISELLEVHWNFLSQFINETVSKITRDSLTILTNLTLVEKLHTQVCTKRHLLRAIHRCLKVQLESLAHDTNFPIAHDLIKITSCLIRNLSSKPEKSNSSDEHSQAILTLNETNFSDLLTRCAILHSITGK